MVRSNFKLIVSGTAVMETLNHSGMGEMVTFYTVDGDRIALLHFCPTNNQPRMRATPSEGDIKELAFSFEGAGNLPNTEIGHEHKLVLEFQNKNHIVEVKPRPFHERSAFRSSKGMSFPLCASDDVVMMRAGADS